MYMFYAESSALEQHSISIWPGDTHSAGLQQDALYSPNTADCVSPEGGKHNGERIAMKAWRI